MIVDNFDEIKRTYSCLCVDILSSLQDKVEKGKDKKSDNRLKLAYILESMIKFKHFPKNIRKNAMEMSKTQGLPYELLSVLYDKFTKKIADESGKFVFARNKDLEIKLICHILVLGLYLNNYNLKLGQIKEALKLHENEVIHYLTQTGCVGSTGKDINERLYKLEAPLKVLLKKKRKRSFNK